MSYIIYYIDSSAVQTPIKIVTNHENMKGVCVPFMQTENMLSNNIIAGRYEYYHIFFCNKLFLFLKLEIVHLLDAIGVLNNIQSFQPHHDSAVATSSNIDTQYELLDSNDKTLSTSVESKLNGSIL